MSCLSKEEENIWKDSIKKNLPSWQCWPQLQWASLWRVFWGLVWGLAMANRINYCAKGQKPFQFSKYHKALISIQQNVKVSGDLKYQTNLLEDYFLAHMCEQFCQRQLFWSKVHAFPESCKILLKFTKLNCSWEGVQKKFKHKSLTNRFTIIWPMCVLWGINLPTDPPWRLYLGIKT